MVDTSAWTIRRKLKKSLSQEFAVLEGLPDRIGCACFGLDADGRCIGERSDLVERLIQPPMANLSSHG